MIILDMQQICDDLVAEHEVLDALVAGCSAAEWSAPTPAGGWDVRDQISHLWFFDQRAALSLVDEDAFVADRARLLEQLPNGDPSVAVGRALAGPELLAAWREDRARLVALATVVDPSRRVAWYGPAMAARSFITARLMETWAHGQDVVDALGARREPTSRLRHVAHIGVRARPYSYAVRGLTMPDSDVRVELLAPGGERWTWGDESASARVSGDAEEFCFVVTQRRNVADTSLRAEGADAVEWLRIAQAFAGGAGPGRPPRS